MTITQLTVASNRLAKHQMSNAEAVARIQELVKRAGELRERCKEIEDAKKRALGFAVEGDEKKEDELGKLFPSCV